MCRQRYTSLALSPPPPRNPLPSLCVCVCLDSQSVCLSVGVPFVRSFPLAAARLSPLAAAAATVASFLPRLFLPSPRSHSLLRQVHYSCCVVYILRICMVYV